MTITIKENTPLDALTTFRIGGKARYFTTAVTADELRQAIQWARTKKLPYLIMGGGSNILFSDNGYPGLVIKSNVNYLTIGDNVVSVGAGHDLQALISATLKHGLIGMEFAAGIPGTVGGAIRGNAGTYGLAMSDVVNQIDFIDESSNDLSSVAATDCQFGYRHSFFKDHNHIIVGARLMLSRGDVAASQALIDSRLSQRHANHPSEPSAGCIFKNLPFSAVNIDELRLKGVDIDKFRAYSKVPAGYLVELAGLKGLRLGEVQISPKHANYIINLGHGTYDDVLRLINRVRDEVLQKFGVELDEEIQIVS